MHKYLASKFEVVDYLRYISHVYYAESKEYELPFKESNIVQLKLV
jgi:hypothetical protein